jgi:tetratricopeptide (TPR) repeat protein
MPGAPGITPSIPPPTASPLPGQDQGPPAMSSSPSPSKKEDAESDEYLEIATLYAQKGKYQKAEELFQKVAKENPSSAKAHNNLGVVRLKQEKYDMAEREFKEALRLDPAFVLPYYNLACLYSKKGVNVEALIYLKKALKRDERVKQWVKADKDFDRLRSDVVFQELVGGSTAKKEGAQKKEATQKTERTQKNEVMQKSEKVQSQDSLPEKEGSLKKEETSKQETQTQEKAAKTGPQKREVIPPQSGPLPLAMPKQEEMQRQETPPGGAQSQEGAKAGTQNQEGAQGSMPQDAQGGDAQ